MVLFVTLQLYIICFAESIYKIPNDNSKFYGVFTTSMNGLMGSAICSFDIKAVMEAFKGRFKEQATSSSAWLPVLSNKVPEPRPGECVNDTETLPGILRIGFKNFFSKDIFILVVSNCIYKCVVKF